MNQQTFSYEDQEIPLTLHVNTVSLQNCRQIKEVFTGLHSAIIEGKE